MPSTLKFKDENGVWQGVDVIKGEPGYTPVKGVDYFTEADVQEIAETAAGMVDVSGGEKEFALINTVELTEDVAEILIDTDADGNPFSCDEIRVRVNMVRATTFNGNVRIGLWKGERTWHIVLNSANIQPIVSYWDIGAKISPIPNKIEAYIIVSGYENSPDMLRQLPGYTTDKLIIDGILFNASDGTAYWGVGTKIEVYGR